MPSPSRYVMMSVKTCFVFLLIIGMFFLMACGPCNAQAAERNDNEILNAIIQQESGGDANAFNETENARGVLQIRPIMVRDVNRILALQGSEMRYTHDDTWNRERSIEMFWIYHNNYNPGADAERIARTWNGGPDGHTEPETLGYWNLVRLHLE